MNVIQKIGFICFALGGLVSSAVAQSIADSTHMADSAKKVVSITKVYKPKPKGPKPIRRELSIGFRLNTDGWGILIDRGAIRSDNPKLSDMFYNVKIWQVEFDEKKDPREMKSTSSDQSSSGGGKSNPFIYGKINNFYTFKIGIGTAKLIAGKPDPGAVSIHWIIIGGASLGLLKPYYIDANYNLVDQPIKYTDQTSETFLDPGKIVGGAGFSQGLSETKMIPGVHLKTGLHFDFSGNRRTIFGVETGMNFEYYSQAIQIMALHPGVPYFFNLYASIQFGKRWL